MRLAPAVDENEPWRVSVCNPAIAEAGGIACPLWQMNVSAIGTL
jgi:hypothetical protein